MVKNLSRNIDDVVKKSYLSIEEKKFVELLTAIRCSLPYPFAVCFDFNDCRTAIVELILDPNTLDGYIHVLSVKLENGQYYFIPGEMVRDPDEDDDSPILFESLESIKKMLSTVGENFLRINNLKIVYPPSDSALYMKDLRNFAKTMLLVKRGDLDGNDVFPDLPVKFDDIKCRRTFYFDV